MIWKTEWWKSLLWKRIKKNKWKDDSQQDISDNIKGTNIQIIGVTEEEEKGPKKIFKEIIVKIFPNVGK